MTFDFYYIFFVPFLISLIDFVTLIRSKFVPTHYAGEDMGECGDFSILVPIFGNIRYLKNVDFLRQYGKRVVLCTTTHESPEFNKRIKEMGRTYGFQIYCSNVSNYSSQIRPNPWRIFTSTLYGEKCALGNQDNSRERILQRGRRDELIEKSSQAITAKYCIFIDGDTIAGGSLFQLTGIMKHRNFDLASVRILPSKSETLVEKLQSVEYELAMDARKVYPWLTSGAAMIARTRVMKEIMRHHSLFFSGGDIEIGKISKMMRCHVGHIHFFFYTDVPETFRAWFTQRMAWFGGGFRHAVINMHQYTWRHPLFYFYTTFLVYLFTPLRWYEIIKYPWILPLLVILYWLLILLFHWRRVRPFYLLFPLYALFQIMILVPCGAVTYFRMAFSGRNMGTIKLRYDSE